MPLPGEGRDDEQLYPKNFEFWGALKAQPELLLRTTGAPAGHIAATDRIAAADTTETRTTTIHTRDLCSVRVTAVDEPFGCWGVAFNRQMDDSIGEF